MRKLLIIFLCFLLLTSSTFAAAPVNQIKVHFIDVGQADSILIQSTGGKFMLIDAGNNEDGKTVVDYLKKQGVKKLDYLVLTHPHEDHIGGADTVIKAFQIGTVYMPKVTTTTKTFEDVVTAMKAKSLKATAPVPGTKFKVDKAECTILAPIGSKYEDMNNYSIAIRMTFDKTSFLFMGDAESVSESEILKKKYTVKADLLKVGHHGSGSSTSAAFLKAVAPKYAVISVGIDNDYGHPHQVTMDRLKAAGIKVYRTDESKTIVCTSNGKALTFNCKPGSYKYNDGAKTTSAAPADDPIVYYTESGKSYHYSKDCPTLSRSKNILEGKLSESGKTDPCDICVKK